MPRSKKNRKNIMTPKPKRLTQAQQRVGSSITKIEIDLSGMSAYRSKSPRRHRGPVTAGAVAGTSNRRHNGSKKT